jgi:hypothetical protein
MAITEIHSAPRYADPIPAAATPVASAPAYFNDRLGDAEIHGRFRSDSKRFQLIDMEALRGVSTPGDAVAAAAALAKEQRSSLAVAATEEGAFLIGTPAFGRAGIPLPGVVDQPGYMRPSSVRTIELTNLDPALLALVGPEGTYEPAADRSLKIDARTPKTLAVDALAHVLHGASSVTDRVEDLGFAIAHTAPVVRDAISNAGRGIANVAGNATDALYDLSRDIGNPKHERPGRRR